MTTALESLTPAQFRALPMSAETYSRVGFTRPPRLAIAGNSQSANTGGMALNSPWFWSQVRQPRLWDWNNRNFPNSGAPAGEQNLAVSGTKSGPYTGYAGATGNTGGGPDFNSPLIVNGLKALAPDILLVVDAITNDQPTATRTEPYANVKAVVQAVAAPKTILLSSPPRGGGVGYRNFVGHYNEALRYWSTIDPSILYGDVWPAMVDDTTAGLPIGGDAGGATAVTDEGLHYSIYGARSTAPILDRLFGIAGVPASKYLVTSQADVYDATNNPYGNLADTRGALGGTTGTHANANSTGPLATGWTLVSYSSQLSATSSKSTLTIDGVTHVAQQIAFAATTTTTGLCEVGLSLSGGGFVVPAGGAKAMISSLLNIINLVGCTGFTVTLNGGAGFQYAFGNYTNGGVAAQIVPTVDEILQMVFPGTCQLNTSGAANINFGIAFKSGLAAGALGSIKLAQVVVKPVPAALP